MYEQLGGYYREAAPKEAVDYVTSRPEETSDGRSKWYWIRLPDGDLILACYPQGDTYTTTEQWREV